jgi:DNA polymerase sigma
MTEAFFDMLREQMIKFQKDVERKLDSVRKERETAINIISKLVQDTYNNSHFHNNFVTVKPYGSMASNLAIDSSDVDLAVVGLDLKGSREL